MPKPQPHTLLCTIGTSLLYPNLSNLIKDEQTDPIRVALAQEYTNRNWTEVATQLLKVDPTDRLCGAEINSVTDLLAQQIIEKGYLHLFHSETDDGKAIAQILQSYFTQDRWHVQIHCVEGLRDDDPNLFRTQGLRNLAKLFGERVRESRQNFIPCAINATGGYKAQIAIAVLMGQALDIPVYYKHERFNAIIPFPPMPVALDFSLWQRASGMFMVLSRSNACEPWKDFSENWDERFEPLVNRVEIDNKDYLTLSATGQIFHETFRSRFETLKATSLPRAANSREKERPKLGDHGYNQARNPILHFLKEITAAKPYVRYCHTTYWHPDLSESTRFRLSGEDVQGIYSNGTWCVKFRIVTTTEDPNQLLVVVADLNDWLDTR